MANENPVSERRRKKNKKYHLHAAVNVCVILAVLDIVRIGCCLCVATERDSIVFEMLVCCMFPSKRFSLFRHFCYSSS